MTMLGRIALPLLLAAAGAEGHGYVLSPPSRGYACKLGSNSGCGGVQYEPQSVEGPDRYPASGPPDGELGSAGKSHWGQMNEQTSTRWAKTAVSGGKKDFTWQYTASHRTLDWRYYITRNGWNQNAVLARSSFEDAPFCSVVGDMLQPPMLNTHACTLPSKSGYHVVLAIWDIGDTAASFYNVIDLEFGGGGGGGGGGGNTPTSPPTPSSTPMPFTPPVPVPPTPSSTPMPSSCSRMIALWGPCIGALECCAAGSVCHQFDAWYAQCLPESNTPPSGGNPPPPANPTTPPTPATTPPTPATTPPTPATTPPTPATTPPTPATTPPAPAPTPVPAPPASNCRYPIGMWGGCLQAPTCCQSGSSCYKQSRWWAMCLGPNNYRGSKIG